MIDLSTSGDNSSYQVSTRFTKIEFPSSMGRTWKVGFSNVIDSFLLIIPLLLFNLNLKLST